MHRLVHTRSQHFVNSPRRTASPLKHKHAITNSRHPIKRRRIGSTAFAPSRAANTSDNEDTEEEEPLEVARSRRLLSVLTSEAGLETANRSRSRRRDGRPNGKGEIQVEGRVIFDVFDSSDEESSPKKRKRSERVSDSGGESGSWVEMEEDEEEPEFIAESGLAR